LREINICAVRSVKIARSTSKLLIDYGTQRRLWLFVNKNDDINIPSKILRITLGEGLVELFMARAIIRI
jgi:hypothetical protein